MRLALIKSVAFERRTEEEMDLFLRKSTAKRDNLLKALRWNKKFCILKSARRPRWLSEVLPVLHSALTKEPPTVFLTSPCYHLLAYFTPASLAFKQF